MSIGVIKCTQCKGQGFISFTDDDGCDVIPCPCTYKVEVKNA